MDFNFVGLATIGVYAITEFAKRATFIPLADGQKSRIRTFAAVLAFISAGLTAYLNDNWNEWLSSDSVQVVLNATVVFVGTWVVHKVRNLINK